jgi:hypothetical protein
LKENGELGRIAPTSNLQSIVYPAETEPLVAIFKLKVDGEPLLGVKVSETVKQLPFGVVAVVLT